MAVRSNKFLVALILPGLAYLLITRVVPLLYSIDLSFYHYHLANPQATRFVGLRNYANWISDPKFWESIRITLIFTSGVLAIQLLLGLGIANLLDRKIRLKNVIISIMILPMISTPVVVGILWRIIFHPQMGTLNALLQTLGILSSANPILWLSRPEYALPTVMFVDVWEWTPFVALILLAGMQSLPQEPFESAMLDGANSWQRFMYIKLPLLKPFIGIALVLRFMDAFKTFDIIWVMTGGGPGRATKVASVLAVKTAFHWFRFGMAGALTAVLLVMLLFISLFMIRMFEVWRT